MVEQKPTQPRQCVIPIHKPNRKEYIFFFVSGIVVSIPFAIFFESLYPAAASSVILIVLVAPFVEELAKVFPLFYRHGETQRSIVTLGILIGVGFGIAEFMEYVVLADIPIIARIPGIVFHGSSAAITAYGIAKKNPLPYYMTAVFLHMANNFFAVSASLLLVVPQVVVLVAVYSLAWRYWHKARSDVIVV